MFRNRDRWHWVRLRNGYNPGVPEALLEVLRVQKARIIGCYVLDLGRVHETRHM